MEPQGFARVKELLIHLLDKPEEERERSLEEATDDPILLEHVRRLLRYDSVVAADAPPDRTRAGRSPMKSPGLSPFDSQRLAVGDILSHRYHIDAFLARGGMGEVFLATDAELGVALALKTIRPEIASDPASLYRFKQEVLLARSISHPNVCRIFDIHSDEERQVTYLTMEYLAGETLASRIKRTGTIPPVEGLALVRQLAEALDVAHRTGIVHRDFKSQNVMLVPDSNGERAVITDFGLATTLRGARSARLDAPNSGALPDVRWAGDEGATAVLRVPRLPAADSSGPEADPSGDGPMGTPAFMSPEQVAGEKVGPASDLYALGVVLFEMATGCLPFAGSTPLEMARARLYQEAPTPGAFAAVDPHWERAIQRLLARDPKDRFRSGHDVVLALEGRATDTQASRHNLPPEHDRFVGREEELRKLAEVLERGETLELAEMEPAESDEASALPPASTEPRHPTPGTRLLTLVGLGGTGKTRLATHYGWSSLHRWPGGVWFCDMSEARSREDVVGAMATALGVPLGKEDPVAQLSHAIAGRGRCLMLLDNFEQVAEHADTLERWVERATEGRFLVTSRERLRLPGETVLELEPLDPKTQGVQLFELRAREHRAGFVVEPSTRAQVEEVVEKLEGFPLAIELAAARLRLLSLEQLRDRLQDRFGVLSGGKRGRHGALRTTLEWSWDLLASWEQSVLVQASVFQGGFTLEAAEAVVNLAGLGENRSVLDGIGSLVDKSWLEVRTMGGSPRFHMYATVHEYVAEKLLTRTGSHPDEASAEARHGTYFAQMGTAEALESLDRHGGMKRLMALQSELDNLVAACRRALARGDLRTAVPSYLAADQILADRDARATVQLGLEVLGRVNETPEARACVLQAVARGRRHLGELQKEREHHEAALTILREIGDRRHEGVVLGNLGTLFTREQRMEEAREHLDAALVIHREVGDRQREGMVLLELGLVHVGQSRFEDAREYHEAALAIFREVGDRRYEGAALGNLGILQAMQGRAEQARECYRSSLAIARAAGNRRGEGITLTNLGILHRDQGRMEEARQHYEAALAIFREVGERRSEGNALGELGNLYRDQGRLADARQHYEAAMLILREIDRLATGVVLADLADLEIQEGKPDAARAHLGEAESIVRNLGLEPQSELARQTERVRQRLGDSSAPSQIQSP